MSKLKLVVVGGGAISETVYLPILVNENHFEVVGLVESNNLRANYLKDKFKIRCVYSSVADIDSDYHAVLIAVPNHLHKDMAIYFLRKEKHVLVEKPMAILADDCIEMMRAATSKAKLMVAMVRRYYDNINYVKQLIETQALGKLRSIEVEEGYEFNWPVASDSLVNKVKAGGGVLVDVGVHVLDTLFFWLGKPAAFEYFDDSSNGIEAECKLVLKWPNDAGAVVRLSRLRGFRNTIAVTFENGSIVIDVRPSDKVNLLLGGQVSITGNFLSGNDRVDKLGPFKKQLHDFASYVAADKVPITSTQDAYLVTKLIQACYQTKKSLFETQMHF